MRPVALTLLDIDALSVRQCRYGRLLGVGKAPTGLLVRGGKRGRGCIGWRRGSYALFVGLLNHRGGDFKRFERTPFREGVGGDGACFTVERNDGRKGNRCVMLAQGQAVRLPRPGVRHGIGGMVSSVHKCFREMSGETLKLDELAAFDAGGGNFALSNQARSKQGDEFALTVVDGCGAIRIGHGDEVGKDASFKAAAGFFVNRVHLVSHDFFSGLLPSRCVRHGLDIRRNEPYNQQVFSTFDCAVRQ
jgi:hypothetical protein